VPVSESGSGAEIVSVHSIVPNPLQPRMHMQAEDLQELSNSIREHGIIQPLIVTRDNDKPDAYTLIAGERRWRAAQLAGMEVVPVIIRHSTTNQQRLELALIENVQRADLTPLETAEAYRQLAEDFSLSHEEIATRVGKSRVAVTNTLRLLKLPTSVLESLAEGKISEGHARAILGLSSPKGQAAACQTVIKNDLNVRQTEELVRKLSGERPQMKADRSSSAEIKELEERLRDRLGTKVILRQGKKGGTLVIHYYSNEELDSILGHILTE
jgi:ParB family chromosome partitioning protein